MWVLYDVPDIITKSKCKITFSVCITARLKTLG